MVHCYCSAPEGKDLLHHSPLDAVWWSFHRQQLDRVIKCFQGYDKEVVRKLSKCSRRLVFYKDHETPGVPLRLYNNCFCQLRICPICQSRKAYLYGERVKRGIAKAERENPRHRWMHLTLTIRNIPVKNLNQAVKHLHDSFDRLSRYGRNGKPCRYKPFPAEGWIKSLEVTRSRSPAGDAHPHLHCLLFLPHGYVGSRLELDKFEWVDAWGRAIQEDYRPSVKPVLLDERPGASKIKELVKYTLKPSDLLGNPAWVRAFYSQMDGVHTYSRGGIFYNNPDFRPLRDSGEDLIRRCYLDVDTDDRLAFDWEGLRGGYTLDDRE